MNYLKTGRYSLAAIMLLFVSIAAKAQNAATEPAMADQMRAEGKIYVVVGVLTIIFIGIVVYLISLDRKLGKLEKLTANKK